MPSKAAPGRRAPGRFRAGRLASDAVAKPADREWDGRSLQPCSPASSCCRSAPSSCSRSVHNKTSGRTCWHTVLPRAIADTLTLMAGVGALSLLLGTGAAWLVTMYRFPWPCPARPIARTAAGYADLYCRLLLCRAARLYRDRCSRCCAPCLAGRAHGIIGFLKFARWAAACWCSRACSILTFTCRPGQASRSSPSACSRLRALWARRLLVPSAASPLPLARPALAAGVALVLMECLNDLGAAQYLGVQTLTVSIYTTWLQRSSLAGAAQIALVALLLVGALLLGERVARGGARVHHTTGRYRSIPFSDLKGWRAFSLLPPAAIPVIAGFILPLLVLLTQASTYLSEALMLGFWRAVRNSVSVAGSGGRNHRCRGPGPRLCATVDCKCACALRSAHRQSGLRTARDGAGARPPVAACRASITPPTLCCDPRSAYRAARSCREACLSLC